MFRDMFKKTYAKIDSKIATEAEAKKDIPKGLWRKCRICKEPIYAEDVKAAFYT